MAYLAQLFEISNYMPHGYCFLWRPDLLVLHVSSDLLISLAYFSVPAAIIVLLRKRPDMDRGLLKLFIAFITLCGLTHLMSVIVIWYPAYAIEGLLKLATALVSIATAIVLWPSIPRIIALPSRAELEKRNREIEELNGKLQRRIDSLATLAGGVSHDFNNLLTVIKGHAQMLEAKTTTESELGNIEAICEASDRAADVCRQMLAYSGHGHFVLAAINLNEIIDSVKMPASPDCDFKFSLSETLDDIAASRGQLEQMLADLCTNAVEAVRESAQKKGEVEISTYMADLDQATLDTAILNRDMHPGKAVVLEVKDNGIGMSPQVRDRLFEPYYSTKFAGRGLGMAAVQGIVRGHHGAVFLNTADGEGTTIRIAFPTARLQSTQYREPTVRHPKRILVVDDEPRILELARVYLERLGIEAFTTTDPEEALRLTRKHRNNLDAVIVDYLMPYTTGSELLAAIADICSVDAYLTSGYSHGEIDDPTLRRVLTGYIAKPFTPDDLRRLFAPS